MADFNVKPINGTSCSKGIGIGNVVFVEKNDINFDAVRPENPNDEIERYRQASRTLKRPRTLPKILRKVSAKRMQRYSGHISRLPKIPKWTGLS